MAVEYINAGSVEVAGVDLSDHVTGCVIAEEWDDIDTTAIDKSARTRTAGLKSWTITIDWQQDFANSEVYQTLNALGGSTTTIGVKKSSAATDTTNPQFTGTVTVLDLTPINMQVGQLHTFSTTWPGTGNITKNNS